MQFHADLWFVHWLSWIKADKNITSHKSLFLENTSLCLEKVGEMFSSKCILLYVTAGLDQSTNIVQNLQVKVLSWKDPDCKHICADACAFVHPVCLFSAIFAAPCCIVLFFFLLFTRFWLISVLYATWWYIDWDTPSRGGRKVPFLCRIRVWEYMRDYFPIKVSGRTYWSMHSNIMSLGCFDL